MISIQKTSICKENIESLLLEIEGIFTRKGVSQEETFNTLCAVSEKADWSIDTILSDTIQGIKNGLVRNWFRRFLISEKYDILINYPRLINYPKGGTNNYYIIYACDDCVLVHSSLIIIGNERIKPHSTIVLSSEGKIKVPEGKVYLYENSITWHGFTSRWNNLYGLYTRKGEMILPCIFESIEQKEYDGWVTLCYKGIYYWMYYGVHGLGNPYIAVYQYNDLILSFFALDSLPSFIKETEKYKMANSKEELEQVITANSKDLFGILDTHFHRLTNEELKIKKHS